MNKTASPRADIYQTVTDSIVAAIEAGAGEWRMPWHVKPGDAAAAMPINAASKKAYRGVNVLNLWIAAQAAGYPAGIWATYKQWQELGAQVRKGEKAALVVFWKVFDNGAQEDDAGRDDDQDAGSQGRRFMARGYHVFNCAQVDGYDAPSLPQPTEPERIDAAETFFAAIGADIRHGGNRAFYSPAGDFIQMPPFSHREGPLLLAVYGYALLSPWIVALFCAVLPLDGEPVAVRIDTLNPRILAFADAGFLRAAAVAQHVAHVVPGRPHAVRSREVLARHKHLGAILFPADNALRL
jgi:hypothetical protein